MEKYREKLEKELRHLKMGSVALIVLIFILFFLRDLKSGVSIAGLLGGMLGYCLSRSKEIKKLLQDEELLKKDYIQLHDERALAIGAKAGRVGLLIVLMGVFVAMIIAAFIDKVVFYTLFTVVVFILIVMILTVVYFEKKM